MTLPDFSKLSLGEPARVGAGAPTSADRAGVSDDDMALAAFASAT